MVEIPAEVDVNGHEVRCFIAVSCIGYLHEFASSASKKISESVTETAQTIKKCVEEGNIDGIIDKVGFVLKN